MFDFLKGTKERWVRDTSDSEGRANLCIGDRVGFNRFITKRYGCGRGTIISDFVWGENWLTLAGVFGGASCGYTVRFDNGRTSKGYINTTHMWGIEYIPRTFRNLYGLLIRDN